MTILPAARRAGHLMPSSNAVLEPLVAALNQSADRRITHHFERLSMTRVADDAASRAQFALDSMLAAVRVLAEAPLDAIVWNGTSASWLGVERDRLLVEQIGAQTGLAASTATLAILRAFERHRWTRVALAVPYTRGITDAIVVEYARAGIEVIAAERLDIESNTAIGDVDGSEVLALLEAAARTKPDCIAVVCTNLAATEFVAAAEARFGVPIVDSIAVTFLETCRLVGLDAPIAGWGYVLENP